MPQALGTQIVLDGRQASGVRYRRGAHEFVARARREVPYLPHRAGQGWKHHTLQGGDGETGASGCGHCQTCGPRA